ncbi:adenylate/guanylate cyclase domain-containing protein [Mycolicibacterium sp.]|uniref:adenylate/guanylate cyclase domain-containing protein n=1 Tax=Mycolicibacterium sp. TaxID=2320850 RepID=UPI0037C7FE7F
MVLLVAVSALVVDYPGDRLAAVVLALGGAAVISGFTITIFTAATNAEPIEAVRTGMDRIGRGDYDARVPVFDSSELGLLQAGFNSMAGGLRERERLRDIFGRQVGRDVARLAEQSESAPVMGGISCEVAVVFVDVIGSTRLASDVGPQEFVRRLNGFFAVAVDVVERHHGWVNKFLGDAILAVFGAPEATSDPAGDALAAARDLAAALGPGSAHLSAGIGVSAGVVVAGNVGDPRRYEYTVMGDPVNEAARLSEVAKEAGGIAASAAALRRAGEAEVSRWRVAESRSLRGRSSATEIAYPVTPCSSSAEQDY